MRGQRLLTRSLYRVYIYICSLMELYRSDFSAMKQWYEGYVLESAGSVYNPNLVIIDQEGSPYIIGG